MTVFNKNCGWWWEWWGEGGRRVEGEGCCDDVWWRGEEEKRVGREGLGGRMGGGSSWCWRTWRTHHPPPPSGSQRLTLRAGIFSGIRLVGLLQSLEGEGDARIWGGWQGAWQDGQFLEFPHKTLVEDKQAKDFRLVEFKCVWWIYIYRCICVALLDVE